MEHITREEVDTVAHLARLALTDEEREGMARQLEDILAFVDKLSEVDVNGVEPFLNAGEQGNVFRPDEAGASAPRADALANAPAQAEGCFRVPGVIG